MNQEVYLGPGALRCLESVVSRREPRRVFLVTGGASFASSGAEATVGQALRRCHVERFCGFQPNPELRDVARGLERVRQQRPDLIIAVGGGSVIDMAKLIRIVAAQDVPLLDVVRSPQSIRRGGVPLVAIPTTSGSGSEATHFAVVYVDRIKHSVAHEAVLADVAIVDPDLTMSLPPRLTAVSGMDAFAQAVESCWSIHSTEVSRAHAREAIGLIVGSLAAAVLDPTPEARRAMCTAAHLAGLAINVSRTTLPHALSYVMTSHFGVPHGHAVALTLGDVLVYNSQVAEEDVADPRGAGHVRRIIGELNGLLGGGDASGSRERISELMRSVGLETRLGELGIRDEADRATILKGVNAERAGNNPRRVTPRFLQQLLGGIA